MSSVRIDLTPRRPAVCSDAAISLDLLVRIAAPLPESGLDRPSLNLSLVIDRSGSMGEDRKLDYARQAAAFAVGQLLPEDRVAVTVFDDEVRTIAPSAPAADLPGLVQRIEAIRPGGSTDLHGGWAEGGRQAESHRRDGALNRVILLSDGLANQGLTDPNAIATEAKGLALRGVSTTTVGLGEQYNEDLLEAMARAGDGNYYYVESPTQLPDLYRAELHGLMATVGRAVRLEIEPAPGVTVADVLNDYDRDPEGGWRLPNLVAGMPVRTFLRLSVPPRESAGPIATVRVSWDDPDGGPRRSLAAAYEAPEAMPMEWWVAMPEDPAVAEQEALLMAARASARPASPCSGATSGPPACTWAKPSGCSRRTATRPRPPRRSAPWPRPASSSIPASSRRCRSRPSSAPTPAARADGRPRAARRRPERKATPTAGLSVFRTMTPRCSRRSRTHGWLQGWSIPYPVLKTENPRAARVSQRTQARRSPPSTPRGSRISQNGKSQKSQRAPCVEPP